LEQYFQANDIEDEKKMAVFLSVIGPGPYGILINLVFCRKTKLIMNL
jgi:hypothetical protein